jgi:hypothetical protein
MFTTGTTIIASMTSNEIVIAADSKGVPGSEIYKDTPTFSIVMAKIVQAGRWFFASSGLGVHFKSGFNADQIAINAIAPGGDIKQIVDRLVRELGERLITAFEDIYKDDPDSFHEVFPTTETHFSFIVAGFENGSPIIWQGTIKVILDSNPHCQCKADGLTTKSKNPTYIAIGKNQEISRIMQEQPDFLRKTGMVAGVLKLVQLEIEANPKDVGPPIAVLRIDKKGAKWVYKTKNCMPIKKYK